MVRIDLNVHVDALKALNTKHIDTKRMICIGETAQA
jgi:hypothetical protein